MGEISFIIMLDPENHENHERHSMRKCGDFRDRRDF
jgi:hypothetical protein